MNKLQNVTVLFVSEVLEQAGMEPEVDTGCPKSNNHALKSDLRDLTAALPQQSTKREVTDSTKIVILIEDTMCAEIWYQNGKREPAKLANAIEAINILRKNYNGLILFHWMSMKMEQEWALLQGMIHDPLTTVLAPLSSKLVPVPEMDRGYVSLNGGISQGPYGWHDLREGASHHANNEQTLLAIVASGVALHAARQFLSTST